ncbi:hypothetical protein B9Z19DRAFT_1062077 [Tuber borchii]|uniref:Uncharacterized protein n=1 Tax=Tuber borchii TaxID=42251 RepID=A0A2T7A356_TUBBO|nr:hypothetical protein B9Z19DRAFT_1062077 [Tuber borchii]
MQAQARNPRPHSGKQPTLTTATTEPATLAPTLTTTIIAAAISAAEATDSIPILSKPVTNSTTSLSKSVAKVTDPLFEIISNSGHLMELVDQLAEMQTGLGEHLDSIDEGKLAEEADYLETAVRALEMLIASRKGGNVGESRD